jgi:hypothetical protein
MAETNPKLNQIIAVVKGKKSRATQLLTTVHQGWKQDRITGISRAYTPSNEDGDRLPPENKIVQVRVPEEVDTVLFELADFYNVVMTQESGNTTAKGSVVVDGKVLLKDVPVTVLLFLEKQLTDLRTFVRNLPVLPVDKTWLWDRNKNCYSSDPEKTSRTQKTPEVIVKYDATKEHPAQTEMIYVDKPAGTWNTIHLSGALPETTKNKIAKRVETLQDAVVKAREDANSTVVQQSKDFGQTILNHIFEGIHGN